VVDLAIAPVGFGGHLLEPAAAAGRRLQPSLLAFLTMRGTPSVGIEK